MHIPIKNVRVKKEENPFIYILKVEAMSYKKKAISAILVLILGIFFTNTGAKSDCNDLILGTPAINWGSANSAKANKVLDIVGKKIVFYYQNKNTGTVKEIIDMFNTIPDKELLLSLKNPGALKGLSGFFMGIFIVFNLFI